jgi:hypothetical protein
MRDPVGCLAPGDPLSGRLVELARNLGHFLRRVITREGGGHAWELVDLAARRHADHRQLTRGIARKRLLAVAEAHVSARRPFERVEKLSPVQVHGTCVGQRSFYGACG